MEDLGIAEAVVAELLEKGVCKLEITVKVVKDKQIPDDLNSFCAISPRREILVLTTEQQALFDRAVAAGLMERLSDGHCHWLSTKALLSYFCGRVFCGDTPMEGFKGKVVWKFGGEMLPKTALERLFGIRGIGNYRINRMMMNVSKQHHLVDDLLLCPL